MKVSRTEVLQMAWAIRRANITMTWSACQVQAWKAIRLRNALKLGVTAFQFVKTDGTVRDAKGTVNADLFTYQYKGGNSSDSPLVVRFFDIEANGWRSCCADRILQIAA